MEPTTTTITCPYPFRDKIMVVRAGGKHYKTSTISDDLEFPTISLDTNVVVSFERTHLDQAHGYDEPETKITWTGLTRRYPIKKFMLDGENKSDGIVRAESQMKPLITPPLICLSEPIGHGRWSAALDCLADVGKLMSKLVIGFCMLCFTLFITLPFPMSFLIVRQAMWNLLVRLGRPPTAHWSAPNEFVRRRSKFGDRRHSPHAHRIVSMEPNTGEE